MKTWLLFPRPPAAFFILSTLLFLGLSASGAITTPLPLDLNGDTIPDIWALRYQAGALSPAADSDGDGTSNAKESAAGTDPLAAGSVIRISSITKDAGGVFLSFPTVPGKRYQMQRNVSLADGTWEDTGASYAGTGGEVPGTIADPGTARFFRVYVKDVDTDNDGVTDYEEILAGFNPNSPTSFGASGLTDKEALLAALNPATVNTVNVQAADNAATEPSPVDTGLFVITRSGQLTPITVNFTVAGTATEGSDYATISRSVTLPFGVNSAAVIITPQTDALIESPESVVLAIAPGTGYAPPTATTQSAGVLIHDRTSANGTGLLARFWNEVSSGASIISGTNAAKFAGNPVLTRTDGTVNFTWLNATNGGSPGAGVNGNYWSTRWTGEVLPEFSQIYTFFFTADDAARVWVNGKLLVNAWPRSGGATEFSGTIELVAGVRVPIVVEYYELTGDARAELRWQSANQIKEIIPMTRLFPTVPPQIVSPLEVLLIQNSPPYNYQIVASGEPTSFGATNLPPGWTINAAGLVSGTPTTAGVWHILLTATNSQGSGSAILNLEVIATGGQITRDVWTNVPGTDLSSILLNTPPNETGFVSNLEAPQNAGDDFGARIRGSLTAPATGSYRFWITADHAAELWISNDSEEVNTFRRATVTAPTVFRGWTEAGAGKSEFLWLEAGKQYYIEVRHKEATGSDHVSVGWLKPGDGGVDPTDDTAPTEVVPSFVLSPYAAGIGGGQGTLFHTNLTPQGAVVTSASGNILLRLSEDETQAVMTVNYSNLTTPYFGMHLHDPNIPGTGLANVVCDFDEPGDVSRQQDGTWLWVIKPRGAYTAEQIADHIKNPTGMGPVYFNVHSTANTSGEIRGNMKQLQGSQTFAPPAAPPAAPADHTNANAAARFLTQSTFGVHGGDLDADGTPDSIETVQAAASYEAWLDGQIALPPTLHHPYVFTNRNLTAPGSPVYDGNLTFRAWWRNSVTAPDQLRQRLAFALSEILVISEAGPLDDRADTLSDFYDTLLHYSLGNPAYTPPTGAPPADGTFHNLLKAVTLHPSMGRYLDMLRNDKPDPATGRIPNENYAREILQLFSIGLYRQWPDGSLMLNSKGEPVPTYAQDEVVGFAHAFTGWGYYYAGAINSTANSVSTAPENWIDPMREIPRRHYIGAKRTLNNVVLPGLPAIAGVAVDPNVSHTAAQYGSAAYIALPAVELEATHQQISKHPNTGPFICRQLIQRLVTSTPSRGYIYRVVQKFNDNGSGVSGDMKAVIKAILLDYEARSSTLLAQQGFGKQREPISRVAAIARAFPAPAAIAGTYTQIGNLINVSVSPAVNITNNSNVYLDFSGATPGDVDDAAYTVISPITAGNTTTFTARPKSTEGTATYSQTAASLVINVPDEHSFALASNVYLDFTSVLPVEATQPTDGLFPVTSAYKVNQDSNDFFTVPAPLANRATYTQAIGSATITVTIPAGHTYAVNDSIQIDFVTAGAPSGPFTVLTSTSPTLTVTGTDIPTTVRNGNANVILPADIVARTGALVATRESYSVNRTGGTVALTFSDWGLNDTETDLSQTPMRSPTVFNFFEPDYSSPGLLAKAGLITPEFQLTSDTTVIRQANFIYNGIFNDLHSIQGISSFNNGGRDIALDFRPWMGVAPGGLPWTHNNNLGAFVDKLSELLMAGQLPSTGTNNYTTTPRTIVNAKSVITDYAQSLTYDRIVTGLNTAALTRVTVPAHGYTTGQSVTIAGVTGFTAINGTFILTVTGPDTFTVPVTCTTVSAITAAATATVSAVAKSITGLSGFCTVSATNHGVPTGQTATIYGVVGGAFTPAINGAHVATSTGTGTFVVPVTRTSGTGQITTGARISIVGGFPDLMRDRIRAVVHLMVTSPDFTIQK
ncbi:MAG: DUF1800 family protein [Verrucomicrobiota bacterium]